MPEGCGGWYSFGPELPAAFRGEQRYLSWEEINLVAEKCHWQSATWHRCAAIVISHRSEQLADNDVIADGYDEYGAQMDFGNPPIINARLDRNRRAARLLMSDLTMHPERAEELWSWMKLGADYLPSLSPYLDLLDQRLPTLEEFDIKLRDARRRLLGEE
jgi:hypothetical protein